jgi:hypothetical protein
MRYRPRSCLSQFRLWLNGLAALRRQFFSSVVHQSRSTFSGLRRSFHFPFTLNFQNLNLRLPTVGTQAGAGLSARIRDSQERDGVIYDQGVS